MNAFRAGIAQLIVLAAALVYPGAAAAVQPPEGWSPPDGEIAHWYLNPGAFGTDPAHDPAAALLERGLLSLVDGVFDLGARGRSPAAALLDPGVLRGAAHRIMLLDLAAASGGKAKPGGPVSLTRLAVVLEIHSGERHGEFQSVLRDALQRAAAERTLEIVEEQVELADGGTATSLRAGDDPLLRLSWISKPDAFVIGIGEGALSTPAAPRDTAPWNNLAKLVGPIHRDAESVADVFIDLDRLRRAAPDEVGWGTAGELLRAWRISNARLIRLEVSASPPKADPAPRLLNISLSWSDRALPTGNGKAVRISTPVWPAVLGPLPADAAYATVLPSAWMTWIPMAMQTHRALHPSGDEGERASAAWVRRNLPALERVVAQGIGVVAIVGPRDASEGPVVRIPMRANAPIDRVLDDLKQVLGSLGPSVSYSPDSQSWAVDCFGRTLTVGIRGSALLGVWNPEQLPPPDPR